LTSSPLLHAHTKHIEIDFHFIRDQVLRCQLHVQFVSSKDHYADAITKPLSSTWFLLLHDSLNVRSLRFQLWKCVEKQFNETFSNPAANS